ncbi:hypothetical protein HFP05_13475 [Rhodanobacter denitrificans]|nr:hypothetical protein [Rhodanobacter denitrificans]
MSIHAITVTIDTDNLSGLNDQYLATLWHVAQANPADISDTGAGRVAEAIGREIIKRFLATTGPELYSHQGHHAMWHKLLVMRGELPESKTPQSTEQPA